MKRIVLELDDDIHAMIKIKAAQKKQSLRQILTELVTKWLKKD